MKWKVKLNNGAKLPTKSHQSAGWDLYAVGDHIINPGDTIKVNTGVSGSFEPGYYLQLEDRSSMGAKGIPRFAGVIDWDYRGEILVVLHNTTKKPFLISHGDKICQGVFHILPEVEVQEVEELDDTDRGQGGFGSTDQPVINNQKEKWV